MIRVYGQRLSARRRLLHLPLQLERYSAVAHAFNVISRDSAPALFRRCHWRSKGRARLSAKARLRKRHVIVRAVPVKRFAAVFRFEVDRSIRPLLRRGRVDHAPLILRCPSHQRVSVARQKRAHIHQRSKSFRAILCGLRNRHAAHAVARQNHRLGLLPGDFANAVRVTFKRNGRRSRPVISVPRQVRRENLVPLGFEQWHNFAPAPAPVPRAMNQQKGRHDRDDCSGKPEPPSQVLHRATFALTLLARAFRLCGTTAIDARIAWRRQRTL
jgi:hypothetical protein